MIGGSVDSSSPTPRRAATIGTREGRLLSLDEAITAVAAAAAPPPWEPVSLGEALGRVLAEDVRSVDEVPPFDNSAMDGYALRAADTEAATEGAPARLRIAGESRAGAPAPVSPGPGEAIAISTGAMLPPGADAVVRMEDVAVRDGELIVSDPVSPGAEVRRAGEDVRAGDAVVAAGTRLGPAELGVIASVGAPEVACAPRPAVAVVTTGDELTDPGRPLPPGGIRNSNTFTVPAQAREAGCEVSFVETVGDDPAATSAALERGLGADVLVVCGGVSVGTHDHVKPALTGLGIEQRFWGIALRPGRPTWFGIGRGGAPLVFGLPGNPVSAMVTFRLLVVPAIAALTGASAQDDRVSAVLDERYPKRPGRLHAVRCSLSLVDDEWHARPTGPQGSHVLTSMLGADGLALVPVERGDVQAGERVEVLLLRPPVAGSR